MERRPTGMRILRVLSSGDVLKPERIASLTGIAGQTVRNLLVYMTSHSYVERVGYAKYKITELGLEQVLPQSSQDQTLGGSKQ